MRNQTSFRLTTTLLPTDSTAKTTTVINKVDSNGDKFYPTFTEETVVLTNDDRTVMETTRAVCTNGALTFTKRGLSDDDTETQVANRKLTRNPWTLAFITAWAWDWIDKDDDITWSGDQTYTGDMTVSWKATYNWLLETKKGVKYPSFEDVAALEAYANPFGWMFATVDSTWELYRYNAVTETWSVVTTATPTNPEMADDDTIGTVRVATDAEFENWTDTGASGEYLVATPSQILSVTPTVNADVFELSGTTDTVWAQAILDHYIWGGTPIIKWTKESYPSYYYLYSVGITRLYFVQPHFVSGSDWIEYYRIDIKFSWTTVTEVRKVEDYPLPSVYVEDATLTYAQKLVDAYIDETSTFVVALSDYNSWQAWRYYRYYLDKTEVSGSNNILTFSTLWGGKHIAVTYNWDFEATNISFS